MQIATHFQDKTEQEKLFSTQLVNAKVSIYLFFLNKWKEKKWWQLWEN